MRTFVLFGLILLCTTFAVAAELPRLPKPQYKTLVIKDIIFEGAEIKDLSAENEAALNKVRAQMILEFTNTIKEYLEQKKLFTNITSEAKGTSDELILQSRYLEIQMGNPGRRMVRFFTFGIPMGGNFDLSIKGRLVDSLSGKEILNQRHSSNTSWYKAQTDELLVKFTKEIGLEFSELVESFISDDFDQLTVLNSATW